MCSNYLSVELTDIVASLLSVAAMVGFLRVWQPGQPLVAEKRRPAGRRSPAPPTHDAAHEAAVRRREGTGRDSRRDVIAAYAPYVIIIIVFGLAQLGPIKDFIAKGTWEFTWPGLDILNAKGEAPTAGDLQAQLGARGRLAAAALRPADDGRTCGSRSARALRRPT